MPPVHKRDSVPCPTTHKLCLDAWILNLSL
jgi:hypothetical protein